MQTAGKRKPKADPRSSQTNGDRQRPKSRGTKDSLRRIGRYDLITRIGAGAFGEVWRATHRRTGLDVAVKIPRFDASQAQLAKRFREEALAAASLRHPHIVSVLDVGEAEGRPFIVYEYLEGVPLSEVNDHAPLEIRSAAEITAKLADALDYAHRTKIVHRDVKPHNVLIDSDGEPQLLDFGLAKRQDADARLTVDGTVLGTPAYMSPEQARGETKAIGPWSDQYSLGMVLYRLVAGRTPYEGMPAQILQQVLRGRPTSLRQQVRDVPRDLAAICDKTLSFYPADRYSSCKDFADDLTRFLNDEPVVARPMAPLGRAIRWSRRNRLDASLIAGVCLLLLVALSVSITGWWRAARTESLARAASLEATAELNKRKETEQRLKNERAELLRATDNSREKAKEADTAQREADLQTEQLIKETRALEAAKEALVAAEAKVQDEIKAVSRVDQDIKKAERLEADSKRKSDEIEWERDASDYLAERYNEATEAIAQKRWTDAIAALNRIPEHVQGGGYSILKNLAEVELSTLPVEKISVPRFTRTPRRPRLFLPIDSTRFDLSFYLTDRHIESPPKVLVADLSKSTSELISIRKTSRDNVLRRFRHVIEAPDYFKAEWKEGTSRLQISGNASGNSFKSKSWLSENDPAWAKAIIEAQGLKPSAAQERPAAVGISNVLRVQLANETKSARESFICSLRWFEVDSTGAPVRSRNKIRYIRNAGRFPYLGILVTLPLASDEKPLVKLLTWFGTGRATIADGRFRSELAGQADLRVDTGRKHLWTLQSEFLNVGFPPEDAIRISELNIGDSSIRIGDGAFVKLADKTASDRSEWQFGTADRCKAVVLSVRERSLYVVNLYPTGDRTGNDAVESADEESESQ